METSDKEQVWGTERDMTSGSDEYHSQKVYGNRRFSSIRRGKYRPRTVRIYPRIQTDLPTVVLLRLR